MPSAFPHFALRGAARLSFTARIGRAQFYRARSASKKDGLAAPFTLFRNRALHEHLPNSLQLSLGGVAEVALYCAHRTSTVSSCAFCEQEGHLAAPPHFLQARSPISSRGAWLILNCARRTMLFQFAIHLSRGVAKAALHCAHRTSTVSSCAFCEQEGHLAAPLPPLDQSF